MAGDNRIGNLNRVNLNLLKVLSAICEERNITLAGERLGLTQSAVSHALGQLRQLFNDELFVRSSAGMTPTRLAADIAERLPKALRELEAAIAPSVFAPAQSTRTFHLACSDYTAFVLVPHIMARLEEEAPLARLQVLPMGRRLIDGLDRGRLDLVVAGVRRVPERMDFECLFDEENVWVVREGHRLARVAVSPEELRQLETVSVDYGFGSDDDETEYFATWSGLTQWTRTAPGAAEGGEGPSVGARVSVPNFFAAARLVAGSDYIAHLPRRLAQALAPLFGLAILEGRPSGNGGALAQVWHRSFGNQPAAHWFRGLVARAAAPLRDEPGGGVAPS